MKTQSPRTAIGTGYCNTIGGLLAGKSACYLALNLDMSLSGTVAIQNAIGSQLGANVNSQSVSNNTVLQIVSNPFNQAMIVLGTFLALGILAGLFGAGILARIMALAGLTLSFIIYMEGQLALFGGMPSYLWWMINGIFTAIMIVIIWEAFDSGGVG